MNGKTILLGVLIAIACLIGFAMMGDLEDERIANELANRRRQESMVKKPQARPVSNIKRLTTKVIADSARIPKMWTVEQANSPYPRVKVPFMPSKDGTFPRPSNSTALESSEAEEDSIPSDSGYAGPDACAQCHRENHEGFVHTAHFNTSSAATPDAFLGPFQSPRNMTQSESTAISFTMDRTNSGVTQTVAIADWKMPFPLDVITGSGKVAQTFLYWYGDALHQAHASYFSQPDQWMTSPGFKDSDANYARVIRSECLECHVTYIQSKRLPNEYDKNSVIWGVTCERCHGPGKEHVDFHAANPLVREAKHITNPSKLSREQSLDVCGQCHGGSFEFKQGPFAFRPGDRIADFHKPIMTDENDDDVHTSDQLVRLNLSDCFKQSEMTCATCHNPHEHQRGDVVGFSKSCMKCHEPSACGMEPTLGAKISDNCIACHMPRTQHSDLKMMVGRGVTIESSDHFIRVDQKATDAFLSK